jgi:hypothetical protein
VFAPPRAARRGGGREVASVFAAGLKIRRSTPRNQPVQRSNGSSSTGAAGERLRLWRFLQRRLPQASVTDLLAAHDVAIRDHGKRIARLERRAGRR